MACRGRFLWCSLFDRTCLSLSFRLWYCVQDIPVSWTFCTFSLFCILLPLGAIFLVVLFGWTCLNLSSHLQYCVRAVSVSRTFYSTSLSLMHVWSAVQNVWITPTLDLSHSWTTIRAPTTTTSTLYSTSTWRARCSTVCVETFCWGAGAACCRAIASSLHRTTSMPSSISSRWAMDSSHSNYVDSSSEVERPFCFIFFCFFISWVSLKQFVGISSQ